jgi:hypothetical protein
MFSQFFVPHHLAKWDVNHDGENVDCTGVSTQIECETLQQENQTYLENDHHDEDVSITKVSRHKDDLS